MEWRGLLKVSSILIEKGVLRDMRGFLVILVSTLLALSVVSQQAYAEAKTVPGEYLVLFKTRDKVMETEEKDREVAVSIMLDFQGEYLAVRYGLEVKNTFSAISFSNGKGMFFVKSEKASIDHGFEEKLLEEMRSDPFIEAVSPNEVQKMISTSVGISKP